jgi:SHS2 domain-containing protein
MKYEILEHKADIKIKVFGKKLEDIYINAAEAMASILYQVSSIKYQDFKKSEILFVESADRETLLVDFLNEILGKSQINKMVYLVLSIKYQLMGNKANLSAELTGYPIESFDEDIKAATYHNLSIQQKENDSWEAIVLFDV